MERTGKYGPVRLRFISGPISICGVLSEGIYRSLTVGPRWQPGIDK